MWGARVHGHFLMSNLTPPGHGPTQLTGPRAVRQPSHASRARFDSSRTPREHGRQLGRVDLGSTENDETQVAPFHTFIRGPEKTEGSQV